MTFSRSEEKCVEYRNIYECGLEGSYQHLASSGEMPRWYVGVGTATRAFAARLLHSPTVIPHPPKSVSFAVNGRNAIVYPWYCLSFSCLSWATIIHSCCHRTRDTMYFTHCFCQAHVGPVHMFSLKKTDFGIIMLVCPSDKMWCMCNKCDISKRGVVSTEE